MPQITLSEDPIGSLIKLSPDRRTATRKNSREEFDNAIVFSEEPLEDNMLLCVTIDTMISTWTGSIQIGVTASNPATFVGSLPSSAALLTGCTWIYTGSRIIFNGRQLLEEYGIEDLDKLGNGDSVGVVRRGNGNLHFVVNGIDQGVAVTGLPSGLYIVVDLYGKCAQITLSEPVPVDTLNLFPSSNAIESASNVTDNSAFEGFTPPAAYQNLAPPRIGDFRFDRRASSDLSCPIEAEEDDLLRFHERCGSNVKLSPDRMSAERMQAVQHFNNGVIMSNRPLRDNEIFEIRIDALVPKWSGSLEIGVTPHSPEQLEFPETMSRTKTVYRLSDLDHLRVGDSIGVFRRSNGCLHFIINGTDQGVAVSDIPENLYAVVDLYGRAAKVSVVTQERTEEEDWNNLERECWSQRPLCFGATDSVAFSTDLRTATFVSSGSVQSATLLSERPLRIGETFYLKLTALPLGAHISIGVAMRSQCEGISHENGIWFFPSRGLSFDGNLIDANYGRGVVTQAKKDDRIGVFISREAGLHFCYNDRDLGVALKGAPLPLWGVGAILLSGPTPQTCVVSLVQPERPLLEDPRSDLRFHSTSHGARAMVLNNGLTAVRIDSQKDLNLAIVTSNRPLRDNEIFEVLVEEMDGQWNGCLEIGLTTLSPEELIVPTAGPNCRQDSFMLSGSAVICSGITVTMDYGCDLDLIRVGTRIAVQRRDDSTLHFYFDERDMGPACSGVPEKVWAVIDMFGQCARVSVVHSSQQNTVPSPNGGQPTISNNHQLNASCGHNVVLRNDARSACRTSGFDNGLIFSYEVLDLEELFEVQIEQVHNNVLTGSVIVGLTTMNPKVAITYKSYVQLLADKNHKTCLVVGRKVYSNTTLVKDNYGSTALLKATTGERIGVEHCADGTMHVYVNGEDQGVAGSNLPRAMFAIFDLFGPIESVSLCSSAFVPNRHTPNCYEANPPNAPSHKFLDTLHGTNIQLLNSNQAAKRVCSFNEGVVLSAQPLVVGHIFSLRLSRLSPSKWKSSLCVGILGEIPSSLPSTALGFTKLCWLIIGKSVYINGKKIRDNYGPNLDLLKEDSTVGIVLDDLNGMHLIINGVDQGVACENVFASKCYAICDLYGRCEKVDVVQEGEAVVIDEHSLEAPEKAHRDDNQGRKENSHEARPAILEKLRIAAKTCSHHQMAAHLLKNIMCLPWHMIDCQMCSCDSCSFQGYSRNKALRKCSFFTLKSNKNISQWNTAYSLDLPIGAIRKCLDYGQLLAKQEVGINPVISGNTKHHDGKTSSPIVKVTPCVLYSLSKASFYRFTHDALGKTVQAKVILQAMICPDSYQKIFNQSEATSESAATAGIEHLKFEEWHTKEKSATSLYSIVVYLEEAK